MTTGDARPTAMMPFFVADYVAATRHMSLAERGAYTDLLFFQWENGHLPTKPERLARLIGCSAEEFASIWPAICAKFVESDGGLCNQRLEEHRAQREQPTLTTALNPSVSDTPDSGILLDQSQAQRGASKSFHQEVIAAYHALLPDLPHVKVWSKKRRQALDARIRERCRDGKPADTIDYWRALFRTVATSDFLCGRTSDFRADLEWLLRPENFLKVIEGRYSSRRGNGGEAAHAR